MARLNGVLSARLSTRQHKVPTKDAQIDVPAAGKGRKEGVDGRTDERRERGRRASDKLSPSPPRVHSTGSHVCRSAKWARPGRANPLQSAEKFHLPVRTSCKCMVEYRIATFDSESN